MRDFLVKIEQNIFDYQQLVESLADYKKPRDKIKNLIDKGQIIRVKKGLYVFAPKYQTKPLDLELLGNLIYGPSYISLEYALSFYNLIPERVVQITSMTSKKTKEFQTPLGHFTYAHLKSDIYSVGVTNYERNGSTFLIATREKALCDLIAKAKINKLSAFKAYLFDDLRIDPSELAKFKISKLQEIAKAYKKPILSLLIFTVQELQHE